ncbi:MAG: phosphatase PAP2 family protein [Planctomycetaceae bacterium]|nr:phosphatase PAP2 family protein [Planctomycetaceae bacterium]
MFLSKLPQKRTSLSFLFFPNFLFSYPRFESKPEIPELTDRFFDFTLAEQIPIKTGFQCSSFDASWNHANNINDLGQSVSRKKGCYSGLQDKCYFLHLFRRNDRSNCLTTFRQVARGTQKRLLSDMKNLYDRDNVMNFGIVLAGSAILANSKLDRNFQRWYQGNVRSSYTNDFSVTSKIFGEGIYFIPITVTSALVYRWCQEQSGNSNTMGEFFSRTARGYAIGAPALLIGQYVLGGGRPGSGSSRWKPFQETHGMSGHAFIGATPFITAAHMTDNPWAKGTFYVLSTFPAWSRINDDAHYISQVLLGWYLSYLSVRAISETDGCKPLPKGLTIFPLVENKTLGIGFHYRY